MATFSAIKWGSDHENTAFNEYERQMTQYHHSMKLRKSGFYIGNPAYLGDSPDGILEDTSGDLCGILEIKCPYFAANISVREACSTLDDFYCNINDDDKIKLDVSHVYYFPVQGSMAMTHAPFCDFVVWTTKSMERIMINSDEELWIALLHKLKGVLC